MNKIFLHGRLASDVKASETTQGVKYARFTVAVERPYSDGGQKTADFIHCVAWRQPGEFVAQHFAKGNGIILEGSLRVSSYTDQAGQKRTSTEVYIDRVEFPNGNKRDASGGDTAQAPAPAAQPAAVAAGADDTDAGIFDGDPFAEC